MSGTLASFGLAAGRARLDAEDPASGARPNHEGPLLRPPQVIMMGLGGYGSGGPW